MGSWYTIGLCLGLGVGLGVVLIGILGSNVLGVGVGTIVGVAIGAVVGFGIGGAAETIAGGVGGFLGALAAAAVVHGALRRGGTRIGIAAYVGVLGLLVCLLALIPAVGYVEAVAIPLLAARMRGRQAARFAGLRTLAK
ncbi:MAG: hypothetical protein HW413_464 [Thermoleophilia bacterium]|nr:hypothetical protein [Thermoleophilia bacterium]